MKNKFIKILISFIALFVIVVPSVKAYATDSVEDPYMKTEIISTYIEVYGNNTYLVEETIMVNFLLERHGIYRYIPYLYDDSGKNERIKITDVEVYGEKYDTYKENGNFIIQIGDPDETVVGVKTYTISYLVKNRDDGTTDSDEFCFNVLPHGWRTSIKEAYVTVVFQNKDGKAPDISNYEFYGGGFGSTEKFKFASKVTGNTFYASSTAPLNCGEGATLKVTLPDDYFTDEEQNPSLALSIIIIAIACLGAVIFLKLAFGKKQSIIPVVNFYPPEKLTSADIGYILDGFADTKDVISLIIYWADKGYLSIEENSENIIITKLRNLDETATSYEKKLFSSLFKTGASVTVSSLKEKFYKAIQDAKQGVLYDHTLSADKKIYKGSAIIAGIIGIILSVLPLALLCIIGYDIRIVSDAVIVGGVFPAILSAAILSALTVLNYRKHSMKKGTYIAGKIALIIGFIAFLLIPVFIGILILKMPIQTIVCFICAAVGGILSTHIKRLTKYGAKLTGEILGFKEFIENAELDKLNALVEENPQYFYNVLPFAYVMGLSDRWAKKFETIAVKPPQWYNGCSGMDFNTYLFMHSFTRSMGNIQSSMISVPKTRSSGSGSGFSGGFSGGGIGGGGGGSW